MSDDDVVHEPSTRRGVITYCSTLAVGGGLAGCLDNGSGADVENAGDSDDTATADTAYEACIEPVGCRTFDAVPDTWLVYNGGWADMAFALGQRDGFLTADNMIPSFFFEPFGLDVPPESELRPLKTESWDKETFYDLDPDVILMSPEYMHGVGFVDGWEKADTEEIAENVAPFFGNNMRRRRDYHDHTLYTLYEGLERLADLFQERERYEAMKAVHDELRADISSRLPPESERPRIGLINSGSEPSKGRFYLLNTQGEGYENKPYRDLDVASAFSEEMEGWADYETMLDIDPEVIMVHWGIGTTGDTNSFSARAFREQYVTPMENDPIGSKLTAVQNDDVYPGQYGEQGPLVNLLQTEMVARQLYPEEFGAFDPESFPEVPGENQLFDRQRVADIINGDFYP
ncbi:ferrichrome ABC transporter substrate-binding protein [Halobacteriales archaeon QS_1_69_70]|nr:MAG: ferrichrome ABC transporter substrate-binding protein [Halobacteriales archaeon QS_1_69_70]